MDLTFDQRKPLPSRWCDRMLHTVRRTNHDFHLFILSVWSDGPLWVSAVRRPPYSLTKQTLQLHHPCDQSHPINCQVCVADEDLECQCGFCGGVRARDLSRAFVGDSVNYKLRWTVKAVLWAFLWTWCVSQLCTTACVYHFRFLCVVVALLSRYRIELRWSRRQRVVGMLLHVVRNVSCLCQQSTHPE